MIKVCTTKITAENITPSRETADASTGTVQTNRGSNIRPRKDDIIKIMNLVYGETMSVKKPKRPLNMHKIKSSNIVNGRPFLMMSFRKMDDENIKFCTAKTISARGSKRKLNFGTINDVNSIKSDFKQDLQEYIHKKEDLITTGGINLDNVTISGFNSPRAIRKVNLKGLRIPKAKLFSPKKFNGFNKNSMIENATKEPLDSIIGTTLYNTGNSARNTELNIAQYYTKPKKPSFNRPGIILSPKANRKLLGPF